MHDDSSDPDPEIGSEQTSLHDWASSLDRIIPASLPAAWVRLWGQPGWLPRPSGCLPRPDEVDVLTDLGPMLGWVAPPGCVAIAVVADGAVLPDSVAGRSGSGRVRVTCLLDRWGRTAGRINVDDRPARLAVPSGGRLLDSMRRAFDLPTPPPTAPASALVERIWLGAVADATKRAAVALGWEQVCRLHPAVAVLAQHGLEVTNDLVAEASRLAPGAWSWEWLRQQTAERRWGAGLLAPELADWMDEGMFSRWVLDETRSAAELLAEAAPGLSPTAIRRLEVLTG